MTIHLRAIEHRQTNPQKTDFPYSVPLLQSLPTITFTSPVTFLVGENGSGKSTLLEAIACAVGSITVGSESVETDPTLAAVRQFATKELKLIWQKRTRAGFFMRSEDFFGFVKRIAEIKAEMLAEIQKVDEEYEGRSAFAKDLAKMGYQNELYELAQAYGDDGLDAQSHGESYFKLFNARFTGSGLYLLDEPEMPLSPSRQLTFLSMLNMMVGQGAQFIIATHSPILLAYPDALILSCDGNPIDSVAFDDLEHVTITRDFLNNPPAYLKHLITSD